MNLLIRGGGGVETRKSQLPGWDIDVYEEPSAAMDVFLGNFEILCLRSLAHHKR